MPDLAITWPENDGWKMERDFWEQHIGSVMDVTVSDGNGAPWTATIDLTYVGMSETGFVEIRGHGLIDGKPHTWLVFEPYREITEVTFY